MTSKLRDSIEYHFRTALARERGKVSILGAKEVEEVISTMTEESRKSALADCTPLELFLSAHRDIDALLEEISITVYANLQTFGSMRGDWIRRPGNIAEDWDAFYPLESRTQGALDVRSIRKLDKFEWSELIEDYPSLMNRYRQEGWYVIERTYIRTGELLTFYVPDFFLDGQTKLIYNFVNYPMWADNPDNPDNAYSAV